MRPNLGAIAITALCVALIVPVGAADADSTYSATWTRTSSGPWLIWEATAFAPTISRLVVFGGSSYLSGLRAETYLFDPGTGTWTGAQAARKTSGPAGRANARMAWDPDIGRVVMFGGNGSRGVLQDTWAFDPSTKAWSALISSCRRVTCPSARWGQGVAWSSVLRRVVMFGGTANGLPGGELADLWAFDGRAWTRIVTTTHPSPRYLFGMAEDPTTGKIVLYGGVANGVGLSDTWLFDPSRLTWTQVQTPTIPEERAEVGMAWLPSLHAIVISSGTDDSGCQGRTNSAWAFDRAIQDWVRITTAGGPPTPRNASSLTTDTVDGSAILLGPPDWSVGPSESDYAWILR